MIYLVILILSLVMDQITKYLVITNLKGKESIIVIDKFLELTYVENRGAAFGILQGKSFILNGVSFVVAIYIGYLLFNNYKSFSFITNLALTLILSGAIGNLIDRFFRKFVVDFIFVRFWGLYDYPVFNIADMCVVIGAILLGLSLFKTNDLGD